MSLYLDDSGTRNPDRKTGREATDRDWFALGGYLINEEEEGVARTAHAAFCEGWGIKYPLHSYDIRSECGRFSWLAALEPREKNRFMKELARMLLAIPVIGHACVIDRPGYNARYREKYGRQTWMLCRTAFAVVCERAAKYARKHGCRLRVYAEAGDKTADGYIRKYYADLRREGVPFAGDAMAKYAPLSAEELKHTLYDLDFKSKKSPMAQIADLYTYPIARGGYEPHYGPYQLFHAEQKLLDSQLTEEEIPHLGIKYSCFELVGKNKKSRG